jgi:hypothetical protein
MSLSSALVGILLLAPDMLPMLACCQQLISVAPFQLRIISDLKLLLSEIYKQSTRSIQALLAVPAKIL